ncbi:MAG: hypothetical protein WCF67_01850 [Chitinophagaceae bacterium]
MKYHKQFVTAILYTMGLPLFFTVCAFLSSCENQPAPPATTCESTVYNIDPSKMEITGNATFDTTANMFRTQVVDRADGRAIQGVSYALLQDSSAYKGVTDANGEFEVVGNNFSGNWKLNISHADYVCLEIKDIPISGGQTAIVRLKRK